ncbi:HU family DNA-binding protein [Rhodobacter capsulatus]|uniref:DNA-binding protein n=1 Tax=Rhodobacter capsulatus TaxID=1061 RepID=A0A1G7R4P9_RHOCA|nr:HU family DNA-binding protein [Rhodobacter capsulatus]WER08404.1 HU family DNA-binding protein [Rhodobacter capsulatus]SDG05685.1 DNA-binding protein [Rhodobacter capsulatus]
MRKSTKKSTAAKAVPPEPVPEELAPEAAPEAAPVAVRVQVKKKDFVERVVLRSGAKKPVVRDLTEAVLAVLGEALAKGETLVLPPLGKISVARSVGKAGGEILHVKLRRMAAPEDAKKDDDSASNPLADAEE